jgi:hypothetical protein
VLKAEIATLIAVNEALTLQVEELSAKTPAEIAVAKVAFSKETFKVGGVKYGFNKTIPAVLFNGEKITAIDVLASEALQKELVDYGSSFVVPA